MSERRGTKACQPYEVRMMFPERPPGLPKPPLMPFRSSPHARADPKTLSGCSSGVRGMLGSID